MAEINDIISNSNDIDNIDAIAAAPVAADEVVPAADLDIAEAKAAVSLDEELFAQFQKFARAIHAASKGKGCGPKNAEVPGVAAHMEGFEGPKGPKCGPDFAHAHGPKGFGPGMDARRGYSYRPGFGGPDCGSMNAAKGFGPKCGPDFGPQGHGPKCGPDFGHGRGPKGPMGAGFGGPQGQAPMNFRDHGFGGPQGPGCGHAPFHGDRMGAMHIPNAPAPMRHGFDGFEVRDCGKGFGPQCGPQGHQGHGFGGPQGPQGPDFGKNFGPDSGRFGRGRVLVALSMQDNMTQKDLAFILGIRPQSLSELVGKLEADGFVTRTRSEADRRAVTVSLTDEGKAKAAKIQAKRNASAETMFAKLTEEEKATLLSLLEKLQG